MRLTPQEPEIPEVGGFTDENDLFGYRDFADRLANRVSNIDQPLVMILDGPWGSGKSVFVKQWAGLLRERGASVIRFDAFESDHYEDAFLGISAEILAAAKISLGGNERATRKYLNKAKKAGTVLAPIAFRVAARTGTAGLLGLEDMEAGGEAIKEAIKTLGNESAKAVEKAISERLRKASEERAALEAFKEALSEVARSLAEQSAHEEVFPLVFIVDELDRCRPPFALSVIERIKHLFSVPGVCFVLVAHLPQLEQAVRGDYGANFDAHTYLEKFYQLQLVLPEPRNRREDQRSTYISHLIRALDITFADVRTGQLFERELQALAKSHNLSLRQLERVMTHVALACAAAGDRHLIIVPLVAGLCVMRITHPDLYAKARRGELTWQEAEGFLQPNVGAGIQDDWTLGWWKFATGEEMSEEKMQEHTQGLVGFRLYSHENLIPFMAEYIDEMIDRGPERENV